MKILLLILALVTLVGMCLMYGCVQVGSPTAPAIQVGPQSTSQPWVSTPVTFPDLSVPAAVLSASALFVGLMVVVHGFLTKEKKHGHS